MSYQCELWHRSLLGKEEATEAHVFLDPVEREVHSTICLCTRHQYEYDDEPNTYYYNIMPLNIAYLKRSSKGEWVLLLWAHQPAPCTNQSQHLKWRRSLQVFQRNNGAQQLLNTLSMVYNRNMHAISSNATTNHHVSFSFFPTSTSIVASSSKAVHLLSCQSAGSYLVTDQSEQGYTFQRPHSAQCDVGHAVFKHFRAQIDDSSIQRQTLNLVDRGCPAGEQR